MSPSSANAGRSVLKCVDGEPLTPFGGAVSCLKSPSIVSPVEVTSATLPFPTSSRKKLYGTWSRDGPLDACEAMT